MKIIAVLTCFNRREKTLACLASLFEMATVSNFRPQIDVVLVDDGSSDGTSAAIEANFPDVHLIRGDGSLFWAGGMRVAIERALKQPFDFLLWLNDDVELLPGALDAMLRSAQSQTESCGSSGLIVGSSRNSAGVTSYGGLIRMRRWSPLKFDRLDPQNTAICCTTVNGNVLLVARNAAQQLGNFDPEFQHGLADLDYGLRATKLGIPIWVSPGYAAICNHDHVVSGSYLDRTLPLKARWVKITSAKGLPFKAWRLFSQRHAGLLWPIYFLLPYARVVVSSLPVFRNF